MEKKQLKREQHETFVPHRLDYKKTLQLFYNELEFLLPYLHKAIIMDKKAAETIITSIQNRSDDYKSYCSITCSVVVINNKPTLGYAILSPINPLYQTSFSQILTVEETFDVLAELHMSKRFLPTVEEILRELCTCNIHPVLIRIFIKSCIMCKYYMHSVWSPVQTLYRLDIAVTIFSVKQSDYGFNKILLCLDTTSNFILLRPLRTELADEVAFELFSIFMDFGIPALIHCHDNAYFTEVMDIMKKLELPFKVPVIAPIFGQDKLITLSQQIITMINNWMKESGSTKWAFGLHQVQWLRNTSFLHESLMRSQLVDDIQSPYHAKFGILPQTEIMQLKKVSKQKLLICPGCQEPIYKAFQCHNCKSLFHITCCRRFIELKKGVQELKNECLKCVKIKKAQTPNRRKISVGAKIETSEESGTILGL